MKKPISFLLAVGIQIVAIKLLLRDFIALPAIPIGQASIVRLVGEEPKSTAKIELAPLNFRSPPVTFDPPQLDLPIGKPQLPQPMVIIEAKFASDVALIVPASQYPAGIDSVSSAYRAQVSVQIFENGAVGDVYIEASDGDSTIDNFLTSYAKTHWRFLPALNDGVPSLSWRSVQLEMTATSLRVIR